MDFERLDSGRRALFLTDEQRMSLTKAQVTEGATSEVYQELLEPSRLESLPGELLKRIFTHVADDPVFRWGVPSNSNLSTTNAEEALRNLCYVSETIRPWAQEVLLESPVLLAEVPSFKTRSGVRCPITLLVRTLLEKPHLGRLIKCLLVSLPMKKDDGYNSNALHLAANDLKHGHSAMDVLDQAGAFVKTLRLRPSIRNSWAKKMFSEYPYPLLGVILALAPNIKELGIIMREKRIKDGTVSFLSESFGMKAGANHLAQIRQAGILGSLESLKVHGLYPVSLVGLEIFPQIQDLVLRTTFHPRRGTSFTRTTVPDGQFKYIMRLHLDVQFLFRSTTRSITAHPINHYGPLLAKFPNLRHLDLDDHPRELYQDKYHYPMLIGDLLNHLPNPKKLLSLRLSHIAATRNSLWTVLGRLSNLEELITPYSELEDHAGGTFRGLPQTLRFLEVYDAHLETINRLHRLLEAKYHRGYWPAFTCVKINFGKRFSDEAFDLFEDRVMFPALWVNAEKAKVEIILDKW